MLFKKVILIIFFVCYLKVPKGNIPNGEFDEIEKLDETMIYRQKHAKCHTIRHRIRIYRTRQFACGAHFRRTRQKNARHCDGWTRRDTRETISNHHEHRTVAHAGRSIDPLQTDGEHT